VLLLSKEPLAIKVAILQSAVAFLLEIQISSLRAKQREGHREYDLQYAHSKVYVENATKETAKRHGTVLYEVRH
jgi:hypothetical protein